MKDVLLKIIRQYQSNEFNEPIATELADMVEKYNKWAFQNVSIVYPDRLTLKDRHGAFTHSNLFEYWYNEIREQN